MQMNVNGKRKTTYICLILKFTKGKMIFYFNPGHETAVLNKSKYYMAPASVAKMQFDLDFLPAWYASADDFVFIANESKRDDINNLVESFPFLPEAITIDQLLLHTEQEVCMWGISPQSLHFFEDLNLKYGLDFVLPDWSDEYRYLNSRKASAECLKEIINLLPDVSGEIIPRFCSTLDEIEDLIQHSSHRLLAKAPYSSSGRGLLWLPEGGLTRTERQILHGMLKKQGEVSIERVLNKSQDFAMEFYSDGVDIHFAGYSLFTTNSKGAYQGNYLATQRNIEDRLVKQLPAELLMKVRSAVEEVLKNKYVIYYKGCIGVDMMIYEYEGENKIQPCLEINMRYNMGWLSLKFCERYLHPHSQGEFKIIFNSQPGALLRQHADMQKQYPTQLEDGRLRSGYLSLCPVDEDSNYLAYVLAE